MPLPDNERPSTHHLQKRILALTAETRSARLYADLPDNRSKAQYVPFPLHRPLHLLCPTHLPRPDHQQQANAAMHCATPPPSDNILSM